jgi:hypothetical protein
MLKNGGKVPSRPTPTRTALAAATRPSGGFARRQTIARAHHATKYVAAVTIERPDTSPTRSLNVIASETAPLAAVRIESSPSVKHAMPAASTTAAAGPERRSVGSASAAGRIAGFRSTRSGGVIALI